MSSTEGEQTSNDDLRDLLVRFQAESRADRLALWAEVQALKEGDSVSATDVAEIKQALAWQLQMHKWVVRHKVSAGIRIAIGAVAIPVINQALTLLLRLLGWN